MSATLPTDDAFNFSHSVSECLSLILDGITTITPYTTNNDKAIGIQTFNTPRDGIADIKKKNNATLNCHKLKGYEKNYCCPLKVSEQRDIHPQCCCNGIADDFSEGKPLS